MFRSKSIASLVSVIYRNTTSPNPQNLQPFPIHSVLRLYAKSGKGSSGKCPPPVDECPRPPTKTLSPECCSPKDVPPVHGKVGKTPGDVWRSKTPVYPECKVGGKKGPTSGADQCGQDHMMKLCPPPVCPHSEKPPKSNFTKHLLIGLLTLLGSLFALYKMGFFSSGESPPPVVKKKVRTRRIPKTPLNSSDIPNNVPFVLIGGGTASLSAFRAIKAANPSAQVLMISNDGFKPYMRPPLSKEMWYNENPEKSKKLEFKQWNGTERSLFYEPDEFYVEPKNLKHANGGVSVATGWTVKRIDPTEKKIYLEDDYAIEYEKCLIATGSSPRSLPVFEQASDTIQCKVTTYRGIYDFKDVEEVVQDGAKNIAVVGGGFLGSELAYALTRRGRKNCLQVHQIFKESNNMGKILPEYLSQWTTKKMKEEDVNVITNAEVQNVNLEKDTLVLSLSNGTTVTVDHVIVAVGVDPNTQLASMSQLETDPEFGGFIVNAELMARSSLWVAGDCTCFYDVKLGRRRVEHHDHAVVTGRLAGENMMGAGKPYLHQSMFWSDLGPDIGYEAIGIVDANLPTVGIFAKATESDTPKAVVTASDEVNRAKMEAENTKSIKPATASPTAAPKKGEEYGKGVIFYLRDDQVVGIVLWNVFNRMTVARQVLKDEKRYEDLNEVAKLFNIHQE